jgi:DNA polymerase III subunit delta'
VARLLDAVLGHDDQVSRLLKSFHQGQLPQTFLFVGPSGIGKKQVALGISQVLLCEKKEEAACGICPSCLRVVRQQHESLRIVEPEKNVIKIEQTREILNFLSFKSLSENRVVILDRAETLNPQAGNSLLKILEEPTANTYFFLMAPSAAHVLTTLRSRSQIVSFQPLTAEQMRKRSPAPEWALRASLGSFERLREFHEPSELAARGEAQNFLSHLLSEPQGFLRPEIKSSYRERSHALSLSRHLSLLLRDAVVWQGGERSYLLNPDQTKLLSELAELPRTQLLHWAEKSLDLERALLQNRDSSLVFEQFWIESRNL